MPLDIAIIGASSAGLYAAEKLARAGKRVGVFEQARRLAPARRTLIVTPHLHRVLGLVPDTAILHHVPTLVLASTHAQARIDLGDPDIIIERGALIRALANQAAAAGVDVQYGHRFQALRAAGAGAKLEFQTPTRESVSVEARAVIGADGVLSDVAKAVGLPHAPTVPILQAEVELPAGWDPAVSQVWFDTDDTRFFYWLIPESDTRGVLGLVGDERAQMKHLLTQFLDRHGFKPLAYQGARIAMHHPRLTPWARVGSAPVLLIGDAAGHVKVTTVGGTVSGIWGAEAAVRALTHGTPYRQELRGLKRELDLHYFMRVALDRLDNAGYMQLVGCVTPPVREFLSAHNRDEMAGLIWRILLIQPRLVTLAPRLLWGATRRGRSAESIPVAAQE